MVCLNSSLYNVSGTGLGLRQDKWRIVCASNKERFLRHLQIFINHLLCPRNCLSPWYTLANKQTKSFCFCEVYIQGGWDGGLIYFPCLNMGNDVQFQQCMDCHLSFEILCGVILEREGLGICSIIWYLQI